MIEQANQTSTELLRERDAMRARLNGAAKAAEEVFGQKAIRYKFSLDEDGRPYTTLPPDMDGRWFALQPAEDDAHIGLCDEIVRLRAQADSDNLRHLNHTRMVKGYQDELAGLRAQVAMIHHALKDAGWHPGRTDDLLTDIIRAKGKELAELRVQVEALTAERTVTHRKVAEASEAMSWAMANCDLAGRSYFFERKLEGLRAVLANAPTPSPLTRPVYLVATGEVHEGQETYTRHDAPVPMADQEVLFTRPCLSKSQESETQAVLSLTDSTRALTRPAVPNAKAMANRLMGWKLPKNFSPDCFISFDRAGAEACKTWPIGTNLFTVDQATEMFEYVLAASPQPEAQTTEAAQKGGV